METVIFKKSPKKQVNKILAWLCSFCYFAFAVVVLMLGFSGTIFRLFSLVFSKNRFNFSILNTMDLVLISILILITVFLIFCLNFYEWFLNPTLVRGKDRLIFKTDDVIAALGEATTIYTITDIKSYSARRNSLIVKGTIEVKEPLQKSKFRNKCELVGLYDEEDKCKVMEIIEEFRNA